MTAAPPSVADMSVSSTASSTLAAPVAAVSAPSSHLDGPLAGQTTPQRSVKRPRPVKSCTECRKRKLRCDRQLPCSQCQKSRRGCRYSAEHDSANASDASDVDMTELPRPSKRNCPPGFPPSAGGGSRHLPDLSVTSIGPTKGGSETIPTSVVEELVLRMDRLEKHLIASRSPARTDVSVSRSQRNVAAPPSTIRGISVKKESMQTRFFGQNCSRVMLNLFDDAKDFVSKNSRIDGIRELFISLHIIHKSIQAEYRKSLAPISLFVDSMIPVHKRMTDILPKRHVCDRLLAIYVSTNETLYRMLHLPSFRAQYEQFWDKQPQPDYFLPQLLAVLSLGSRFEKKHRGLSHERVEGVHIPTACALVRSWLDSLKGKQLVNFATLQTELLLVQAQRMVVPRVQDSWAQMGSVVRMAMAMGLHRDPSEFSPRLSVFAGEMRRRLWYCILDMDFHLSLSCNLPCSVREGDYTCRSPRNLDDADLRIGMKELPRGKPVDQPTDNQLQVFAAMSLATRIRVSHLLSRIESVQDFDEVLEIGGQLERSLEDINFLFPRQGMVTDAAQSKQWQSRVILDMTLRRPLLALYRPFALGSPDAPPQIARSYLRSSMMILKYTDDIDPMLAQFDDVIDMYHQILKQDIIQAAFGICYFIKTGIRAEASSTIQPASRMSPTSAESPDDRSSIEPENYQIWSPPRLVKTVERTLDLLIHNLRNDVKDIITLTVVLACVQQVSREEQADHVRTGLRSTIQSCMRVVNISPEELGALARQSAGDVQQNQAFIQQQQSRPGYPFHNAAPGPLRSLAGWMVWQGWDDEEG